MISNADAVVPATVVGRPGSPCMSTVAPPPHDSWFFVHVTSCQFESSFLHSSMFRSLALNDLCNIFLSGYVRVAKTSPMPTLLNRLIKTKTKSVKHKKVDWLLMNHWQQNQKEITCGNEVFSWWVPLSPFVMMTRRTTVNKMWILIHLEYLINLKKKQKQQQQRMYIIIKDKMTSHQLFPNKRLTW